MAVDLDELRSLPAAEKLRIVEMLWDELAAGDEVIPLPDWVQAEVVKRRDELRANPSLGLSHEAVWQRIDRRNEQAS